jgi:hypothetical protein
MKNLWLLYVLLLHPVAGSAQNKLVDINELSSFPSYKTIVTQFFSTYSYSNANHSIQLQFARKPDGWYVRLYDYVNNAEVSSEHFWQPHKYLKLKSFTQLKDDSFNAEGFSQFYTLRDSIDFKRHPFFGYSYWAEDIVRHLEPQLEMLNDTLVYGLARAYSALAVNLTSNQFNFKQKPEIEFVAGGNCITPTQREKLVRLNKKAIQYFGMADSLNPNLCVVVGTINTKYCNEYVDLFYKLWPLENIETAAALLPSGLYSENMLTSARNYLASCEPNSILFSNGDNDTYPLYYVQATEGFRRDVTVINISMQATAMHIDATTRGFAKQPITYAIPLKEYEKNYNYLVKTEEGDTLPFEHITSNIYDGNMLNAAVFSLNSGGDTYFTSSEKKYILRSTLAVWDIINSNPTRPIHFSQGHHASVVGLEDDVIFNGFTTSLSTQKKPNLKKIIQFLKGMQLRGYDERTNYVYCTHTNQWQNSLALNTMRTELVKLLYYNRYKTDWQLELKEIYQLFTALNQYCFAPLPQHITPDILAILDKHYSP